MPFVHLPLIREVELSDGKPVLSSPDRKFSGAYSYHWNTYVHRGRLPFSNGFETMLLIAWCAMLIALLFARKMPIIVPFSFFVVGMYTAGCSPEHDESPDNTPCASAVITAVQHSRLVDYAGVYPVAQWYDRCPATPFLREKVQSSRCCNNWSEVRPIACCAFTPHCCSWGRESLSEPCGPTYHGTGLGWDPKEVWALITLLLYSLVLHGKNIR